MTTIRRLLALSLLLLPTMTGAWAQQASRNAREIPDVYVAVNNSFIITVPNLTKVAVGNPAVVDARVISPTEVLILGAFDVSGFGAGVSTALPGTSIRIATSEVYVWSGDQRYVYRVVNIDNRDPRTFPYGVDRIDVEPNRVILHGQSADMSRTILEAERIFKSRGINYELKIAAAPSVGRIFRGMSVDTVLVEQAIARGYVIEGMTLDEMQRSQKSLPPVYRVEMRESHPVDVYRYPTFDVVVADGTVIEVRSRESELAREAVMNAAIQNHIALEGMTVAEMQSALGAPSSPPTAQAENGAIVTTYVYPAMRVRVRDGYVIEIQPSVPTMPAEGPPAAKYLPLIRIGNVEQVGRVYRFRYVSGAEVLGVLNGLNAAQTGGARLAYTVVASSPEGSMIIYADTATLALIDNVAAFMDRPRPQVLISIDTTVYQIPGPRIFDPTLGIMVQQPARQVGFLVGRFSPLVDEERRRAIIDELRRSIARLPEIANQTPLSFAYEGGTISMNGPPEQVELIRKTLVAMLPRFIDADLMRALGEKVLLNGMTRLQVEAALGYPLDTMPLRTVENGQLYLAYDVGDRLLRFSQDILTEVQHYPTADDVRNAIINKQIVNLMLRSDVEKVLGDRPLRVTANVDGTQTVKYDFGDALYYHDRIIRFDNLSGSEMSRRGISVAVPYAAGAEFQMLTPEEQVSVMEGGNVMTGMTERDVMRVLGGAPFSIRPGDRSNEKIYTYSEYVITFRDGVVVDIRQTGENSPRIINLKSRRASEIASLIGQSYPDVSGLSISIDSVSNRLIIRAPSERFAEIERFAKTMDQGKVPQVLIEAKFVEVNRSVVKQLGINWALSTNNVSSGNRPFGGFGGSASPALPTAPQVTAVTGSEPGSPTPTTSIPLSGDAGMLFGILGGRSFNFNGLRYSNIDILVSALESHGDAEVISSPRVATLNNQAAHLESTDRVNDVTTTTTIVQGGTSTATTLTPHDVGITLDVNPNIGADGIITLDLNANVSRVLRQQQFGSPTNVILVNEISNRTSRSRIMVRSGTPLVIGGLSARSTNKANQRVPLLGDIPWLGKLFRSDNNTATDVDLLIFLTARILPADGTMSPVDEVVDAQRPAIPNPVPSYANPPAATPASAGK